jgi:hypothetical protein
MASSDIACISLSTGALGTASIIGSGVGLCNK